MAAMKNITILGSTGSVGRATLKVLDKNPGKFRVFALSAKSNVEVLYEQCLRHEPKYAAMLDEKAAQKLRDRLAQVGSSTEVLTGDASLQVIASSSDSDYIMAAIVGAAGLLPTLAAVKSGKRVLLANKESLVMGGQVFMQAVRECHAELIPIDSEHNAIFQCLPHHGGHSVHRILLTASGGPFRGWSHERQHSVTPAQACAHPRWSMGRKISVDSATLMNKGLEVIEARWLFEVPPGRIEVVVHPQSIVHSLVEYIDGSVLAQLSNPDMRVPIASGLAWPERISTGVQPLDLCSLGHLDFEPPDMKSFPCLPLAIQAAETGGNMPVVLNAANEIAVQSFLDGLLPFTSISDVVGQTLDMMPGSTPDSIDEILECDRKARAIAKTVISRAAA
ncbi:MAG: 1-deoxy-D-xylulose-5-phosphate reductoisomerase [Gammaproteobacteria bacterium]|nr:1-deoxy-D-xylulose-5-phosphate reductoisomerase [Gammaproteobacteria bacterium]MDE2345245.1 1-deoxy-D-xylulose-5-phosphate reductoisomerase [Gammaproteobacteria bacterium]